MPTPSATRPPSGCRENNPVKRPDWQTDEGQKISSGNGVDARKDYCFKRVFFKNTLFNQEKIGQFSGPAAAPKNPMNFWSYLKRSAARSPLLPDSGEGQKIGFKTGILGK
jgi:hypothetical protein